MITLNTILYEGNFNKFLNDDCWFFKFKSKFITKKLLTINNLISTDKFLSKVNVLKEKYEFDIIYVSEQKDFINKIYNLNIDENTTGYYYTIPYFVAIDNITTEYILNIASDSMDDILITNDFLFDSLHHLKTNQKCSTCMISWVKNNKIMPNGLTVGQHEENETSKDTGTRTFNYSFGFTDQFFIGRIDKLKAIDYNIPELISGKIYHGPEYGGNSFEKRMVGHQITNNVYNCIYKGNDYYIHDNNYY
jgi:hypothetical protein